MPATAKLYFDGIGGSNTYIQESAGDNLVFHSGGLALTLDSGQAVSAAKGLHVNRAYGDEGLTIHPTTSGVGGSAHFTVYKSGIADNSATDVFTITQSDLGNGGRQINVVVTGLIIASLGTIGGNEACKGFSAAFAMSNWYGATTLSSVTEIYETAQVTGNATQKGIGTVTMTLVGTSETVTTVQFAIDVTGSEPDEARVMLDVAIQSYGSGTLPTVAAV
jgi:hypothetical protein